MALRQLPLLGCLAFGQLRTAAHGEGAYDYEGVEQVGKEEAPTFAAPTYVATVYGKCIDTATSGCDVDEVRERTVTCHDAFTGQAIPTAQCHKKADEYNLEHPSTTTECSCAKMVCQTVKQENCPAAPTGTRLPRAEYEEVGCFEDKAVEGDEGRDPRDFSCMMWEEKGKKCNAGLPFYARRGISTDGCFEFCLQKGLDIFGIVNGETCRCGASKLNTEAWQYKKPPYHLLFDPTVLTLQPDSDSSQCKLKAYRFLGPLIDNGVPPDFLKPYDEIIAYEESILEGTYIAATQLYNGGHQVGGFPGSDEEVVPAKKSQLSGPGGLLGDAPSQPVWPPCTNSGCHPGFSWDGRTKTPPTTPTADYEDFVVIPYVFDDVIKNNPSDPRAAVFRSAADAWEAHTCLFFVEYDTPPSVPYFRVGIFNTGACSANVGMHPTTDPNYVSLLNMGWCNSFQTRGNVIHEIGHILGMYHEHQRPDGAGRHNGFGPNLIIHWQNIDDAIEHNYLPQSTAYAGSAYDGPGDPHVGNAPYDFGSIMQYPVSDAFETVPQFYGHFTGQRYKLAHSDVAQALDMYQCRLKSHSTITTTTTTAPPWGSWTLSSGPCAVDGFCITSHNFPQHYGRLETCEIDIGGSVQVYATHFNTEAGQDYLYVNNVGYSGQSFNQKVTATGSIYWWSSRYGTSTGWKICRVPTPAGNEEANTEMAEPTAPPTPVPTYEPTHAPTDVPTDVPTKAPTKAPTKGPTKAPTKAPTAVPTAVPTAAPTRKPTPSPSHGPTAAPTRVPPTAAPTAVPPTAAPTARPTPAPTATPPTAAPTDKPTAVPTAAPTARPTAVPTAVPTRAPTLTPTMFPTIMLHSTQDAPAGATSLAVDDLTGCRVGFVLVHGISEDTISACIPTSPRRLQEDSDDDTWERRLLGGPGTIGLLNGLSSAITIGQSISFQVAMRTVPTNIPIAANNPPHACFSAEATIQAPGETSASKALALVRPGDRILAAMSLAGDLSLQHEEVMGFLHDVPFMADMLVIEHSHGELRVSANHLLPVRGDDARREKEAADLLVGDALLLGAGEISPVLALRRDLAWHGMRAPLTASGAVVVDNVVASSYAVVRWLPVPHSAMHAAFFALRVLWKMADGGDAIKAVAASAWATEEVPRSLLGLVVSLSPS
eukprot:TRINITY_DN2587_c0_g1_i1.p1 TRINITY_DN2587_c0_g1~~TRINITY_DN2587_c0_g1_i1.p1  ORF type:complete len:1185 (-),score=183.40 TRINITY_DN2587_c0_g1_i1:34-3504(-)